MMQTLPIDSPWQRGAGASFIGYGLTGVLFLVCLDTAGRPTSLVLGFLASVPVISMLLYILGMFFSVRRLKYFVLILGAFVFFPVLVFFISPAVLLTMLVDGRGAFKASWWGTYVSLAIFLSYRSVRRTKAVERKHKYLASEIKLEAKAAYVDRDDIKDISQLTPRREFSPRVDSIIATAICLIPSIYTLQTVLLGLDESLDLAVYLSILSTPLSLYLIVEICSGYYLWVYLISEFESRTGRSVFLRSSF